MIHQLAVHWFTVVLFFIGLPVFACVFLLVAEVISEWHIDYLIAKRRRQTRRLAYTSDTPIYDSMVRDYGKHTD